jgi:hypothetical protein
LVVDKRQYGSKSFLDLCDAALADTHTVEINDIVSVVAENARGLIFLKNNSVLVRKYFKRILFVDPHGLSYADREDYTTELIDLSYNAC